MFWAKSTIKKKIQPEIEVNISPDVSGEIILLNVKDGQNVNQGDLLLKINPEIYNGRLVNVEVEVNSDLTRGMTVVDWWNVTDRPPNAYYINKVKENKFFETVLNNVLNLEI